MADEQNAKTQDAQGTNRPDASAPSGGDGAAQATEAPSKGDEAASQQAGSRQRAGGAEEVMAIIQSVEAQLEQLSSARTSQERVFQAIAQKQAEIESLERDLSARRQRLEQRESELEQRFGEISQREDGVERRAREIEKTREEVTRRAKEMTEQEERLSVQQREVMEQRRAFESQFTEILERAERFKKEQGGFAQVKSELESRIERMNEALGQRDQQIEQLTMRRDALESELSGLKGELEAAKAAADGAQATAEAVARLREAIESREQEAQDLMSRLDATRDEAERMRSSIGDAERLAQELKTSQDERDRLKSELGQLKDQSAELERAREEVERLRKEVEASKSPELQVGEQMRALQGELQKAASLAADLPGAGESLKKLHERLKREGLAQERIGRLSAETQRRREEVDIARQEAESLREQLQQATGELEKLRKSPLRGGASGEQIARRDKAIEALTERLKHLETERAKLLERASKAATPGGGAPARDSEFEQRRRARLRAVRDSLREKAQRLAQARDMLERRQSEQGDTIELRAQVQQLQNALQREQALSGKRMSRRFALVSALVFAVGMAALAGASWFVSGAAFPGPALATASVGIDARGGTLDDERLARWRAGMERLASDPSMTEIAAKRMQRRGIEAFASAAELSDALNRNLDVAFPASDTMELAFAGDGTLQSERVLETFLAALVTAANDASASRGDNASVVVRRKPQATSAGPALERRAVIAGVMWGVSTAALFVLTLLVARAAAKARERMRQEATLSDGVRADLTMNWS